MAVRAASTETRPSHHISFTDTVGVEQGLILCDRNGNPDPLALIESSMPRTALQLSQGQGGYDDLEYPFTAQVQSNWSGGRGQKYFEKNTSKYYDGYRVDTTHGNIILGPKETYSTGYYTTLTNGTRTGDYAVDPSGSVEYAASDITVGSSDTVVKRVTIPIKKYTGATYPITITARIYTDSSGPDTLVVTSDPKSFTLGSLTSTYQDFTFVFPATSLTALTKYWVSFDVSSSGKVYLGKLTSSGESIYAKTTGAWASAASNTSLAFILYTTATGKAHLFEYKGQLYAATCPEDGTAGSLLMNGYRGTATSNAADKYKTNTTLNLSGVDLSGKIIKITGGAGSKEEFPYRTIVSNTTTGTNDSITVSAIWKTTQDTTTEFVILGCDTWQSITGSNDPDYPITDVLVTDEFVYMCQGDNDYISRYQGYTSSGTWTSRFADDGTNKADLLMFLQENTGKRQVWRAVFPNSVSYATMVTSWANMSFGTAVSCGSSNTRITNLIPFGTPTSPYVIKEDSFGYINNKVYIEVPLSEMASVSSHYNGLAALRHDVYLYMGLLNNGSLERYYNNHLDDIGPSTDEGLPKERQGPIADIVGYPGRFYVAVDAGDAPDHFSSVLCWNGEGWCEIYRAPGGKRIRKLWIQVIPDVQYQRLWISEEEDLVWVPIALNPLNCSGYTFTTTGSLVSAWKTAQFKDLKKYIHSEKLFTENLTSNINVLLEFQTDTAGDASDWTTAGTITTSPNYEQTLSASNNTSGIRYRSRLTLTTNSSTTTPVVEAQLANMVVRQPVKASWTATFLVEDNQLDLNGIRTTQSAHTILDQLRTWANSPDTPCPLTMACVVPYYDAKTVFIEKASVKPLKIITSDVNPNKVSKMVCQMTIIEV